MPAKTSTSVWVILGAASTIMFGVFGFVWSVLQGQVNELRSSIEKIKEDARWQYATKDYVNGKIEGLNNEETTYRRWIERELSKKP